MEELKVIQDSHFVVFLRMPEAQKGMKLFEREVTKHFFTRRARLNYYH